MNVRIGEGFGEWLISIHQVQIREGNSRIPVPDFFEWLPVCLIYFSYCAEAICRLCFVAAKMVGTGRVPAVLEVLEREAGRCASLIA